MAGYVHHAVAHRRSDEYAYGGDDDDVLEGCRPRAYGRRQEVDGVVAHSDREVEHREQKQKDDNAEKQYVHLV